MNKKNKKLIKIFSKNIRTFFKSGKVNKFAKKTIHDIILASIQKIGIK